MWRYWVGALAGVLMAAAALFLFRASATADVVVPPPPMPAVVADPAETPLPDRLPEAAPATREERRFNRYDKDRDARITRDEYLASRRKAFAKLDKNGDGRLDFEEWAVRTTTKFAGADKDRSNSLNRAEFATTAVKRRAPRRRADCPPAPSPADADEG